MKAKLVKVVIGDEYRLDDENGLLIASSLYSSKNKLSLKNCQAIERGYDLDELFDEVDESIDYHEFDFTSFRLGFQKALELLGDKKFSEFLDREKELGISDIKTIERIQWYYNTYFDKSQQTEWEVTYNPEELDADGCLILKRI